jgi:acyl dehydratase
MPINPDAVGATSSPKPIRWTSTSSLLYALSVGAGVNDPTGFELEFTTENSADVVQKALPTMCVVLGSGFEPSEGDGEGDATSPLARLGTFDWTMLVHGEQRIELHQPLAVAGAGVSQSRIVAIHDKGKAAVVVLETEVVEPGSGDRLYTTSNSMFIRGEGGWGGDRGPSSSFTAPEREPDHVVSYPTRPDQALLYRLNGDRNPLHSDPSFATRAGFPKPILHGLCTYGFTGRALLHTLCASDPARVRSMAARFASPVFPGDTLDVRMWRDGDQVLFQTWVGDRLVVDAGVFEHS